MMTGLSYALLSTGLAVSVVLASLWQRPNVYSAAVYLSRSNACTLILWNFGVFVTICVGRLMQAIYFGSLRMIEVERLRERLWYSVTETLLALTIFRDEFDTAFVALFVSLLFVKVFHWLAADRVEYMEQTPSVSRWFHIRMVAVLAWIWTADLVLVGFSVQSLHTEGPSVMIMFAAEYLILLATVWATTLKYIINTIDLSSEIPWENKSIVVTYVDLATEFIKLVVYVAFFSFILTFYGLPLNILRDVYITARSFLKKCRDLSRYQLATKNMEERYPNASQDELANMADPTCIICREELTAEGIQEPRTDQAQARRSFWDRFKPERQMPNETPKKLPCGHLFHFHCLRSWLERQQACPTCRRSVLPDSPTATAAAPAAPAQAPQLAPPLPQPGQLPRPATAPRSTSSGATPHDPPRQSDNNLPALDLAEPRPEPSPVSDESQNNPFLKFRVPPAPQKRSQGPFASIEALLAASKYNMPAIVAPELKPPPSLLSDPPTPVAGPSRAAGPSLDTASDVPKIQLNGSPPAPPRIRTKDLAAPGELPPLSPSVRLSQILSDPSSSALPPPTSKFTKETIEERVRLLENVHQTVDQCLAQLKLALDGMASAAPSEPSSPTLAASPGPGRVPGDGKRLDKGKAPVEGVHAVSEP